MIALLLVRLTPLARAEAIPVDRIAGARRPRTGGCLAGRWVTRDDCRTIGASRRHPFCSLTPPNLRQSRTCVCQLHRSAHVRGKANAARILAFLGGFSLAIGLDLRRHELLGVRGDQSRHRCACLVPVACCCAPSGQECHISSKWVVEAVYTATMSIPVYPRWQWSGKPIQGAV